MSRILYWPYVRKAIKDHFEFLLDEEFRQTWFNSTNPHAFWHSLDFYIFDYLYDGPPHLLTEAYEKIGICLYNEQEAGVIQQFMQFFLDTFKGEMPDTYYVNHPKWPELLDRAKQILDMMEANNQKYNFQADIEQWDTEQDEGLDHGPYPTAEDRARFIARLVK